MHGRVWSQQALRSGLSSIEIPLSPFSSGSRRGFSTGCKVSGVVRLALFVDLCSPPGISEGRLQYLYRAHQLPWLRALAQWPHQDVSLTLNSWALQQWLQRGWDEGPDLLRQLYDFGKVELCGTASHHTILPLAPESVAFRQVRRNSRLLQQVLHPEWRPAGFYPPELAFGHELSRVLLPLGFRWCLADDSCYAALHGHVPQDHITRCGGLLLLLCSRMWSGRLEHIEQFGAADFAARHQAELQHWLDGRDGYQVLRLPAEALGASGVDKVLAFLDEHRRFGNQVLHLSALVDSFRVEEGEVPPGSCRTRTEDFWAGSFFAPWRNGDGETAWHLSELAILELEEWQDRLDELLSSSTFASHGGHGAGGLHWFVDRLRSARDA